MKSPHCPMFACAPPGQTFETSCGPSLGDSLIGFVKSAATEAVKDGLKQAATAVLA